MKELIDHCLINMLPNLTKEEADFIENVIEWPDEKRMAFKLAKRIFEEKDEE